MATSTTRIDFTEGAAPATPATSAVRLYAKADGLLYSKDDAGVETVVTGGGGGGYSEGTAFPGAPTTGDKFFHNTYDLLFYYDGTRWLSATLFTMPFSPAIVGAISGDTSPCDRGATMGSVSDIFLCDWFQTFQVVTTNDGTKFWTFTLVNSNTGSTITSFTTAASAPDVWLSTRTAINAVLAGTTTLIQVNVTRTSTAGNLYRAGFVTYRQIGT